MNREELKNPGNCFSSDFFEVLSSIYIYPNSIVCCLLSVDFFNKNFFSLLPLVFSLFIIFAET